MKYTSKNFHLHYIPQYKLLIKTGFIEETLVVIDESNEVQVLHSYPSNQPDSAATKLLGLPFQQVFITLALQGLVFIPSEVYNENDRSLYQQFLPDDNLSRTHKVDIDSIDVSGCYQFDLLTHNKWKSIFPKAIFVANFSIVLQQAQAHIPLQGEVFGIHMNDNQAELFAFKNGKFQFYQIFDVHSKNDLNYFILNTCNSIGISPKMNKILVSGLAMDHEYTMLLEGFSTNLVFIKPTTNVHSEEEKVNEKLDPLNTLIDSQLCA
ncbi:MAG: DUF3822 family protein [Sphingobacterium sp.]|uniref:DUF3822 family protein n=1 Tax=Sphingobacterium sp. JB170 TaxID=1434842 RepID=UPI00097EF9DB|nr:DUF3822 family protein [Sphingobacterium sp. JB170]SJN35905.1 hypothetical protein FM107_08615 [Sphingobacterium sp. JB170]